MTVSVLVEGTLKDGERDGFTASSKENFKVTRTFAGSVSHAPFVGSRLVRCESICLYLPQTSIVQPIFIAFMCKK